MFVSGIYFYYLALSNTKIKRKKSLCLVLLIMLIMVIPVTIDFLIKMNSSNYDTLLIAKVLIVLLSTAILIYILILLVKGKLRMSERARFGPFSKRNVKTVEKS